jgi:hypothetical protein
MRRLIRAVGRRLVWLVGPYRCLSCGGPLRPFTPADLSPDDSRARRLGGTLGGLLASGYVCEACTPPGGWVLIE